MKFCEGALKRQIGQMEIGVNVKGRLDLPPLRDYLNPHQPISVINSDQVVAIWRHVGSAGDVAVLADDGICYTVQDELWLCGSSGIRLAVYEVVPTKMGVGDRLGDAIILLQANIFYI